jgi:hypothetical protein
MHFFSTASSLYEANTYPHFTDDKSEVQRDFKKKICPRPHSKQAEVPGPDPCLDQDFLLRADPRVCPWLRQPDCPSILPNSPALPIVRG